MGDPSPEQEDLWAQLWRSPQAFAWNSLGWTRSVARYACLVVQCEMSSMSNAALLAEVRQMEDRLGLSPMAMKRLQWEVSASVDAPAEAADNVVDLFG